MSDHATVGGGRYQLRELLGRGGMAAVYLAWDTVLERRVAVKTMRNEVSGEEAFRERFRFEAQAVAKLSHPNIVSVFDTGEERTPDGAVPYIVMEYVEGEPLRDALEADAARYGAMPADKALRITAGVLAALDASHETGLVHRDIKPGNVMLTPRGVVKVMDFGIARATQSGVRAMTQTGMVVGTPQYLSPEQALGRAVDARSDLYAVGVMLFELITGRVPFDADSGLAVAYAHVTEAPPAASELNRAVTPELDALIARALRKNPDERFRSAGEMLAACRRVAEGLTGAPPSIDPEAARRPQSGSGVSQAVFPGFGSPEYGSPEYGGREFGVADFGRVGPGGSEPRTPSPTHSARPGPATPSPYAPAPGGGYGYPGGPVDTPPAAYGPAQHVPPASAPAPEHGRASAPWQLVVASVVAIALVASLAIVVVVLSRGSGDPEAGGGTGTPTGESVGGGGEPANDEPRYKTGDPERTIEPSRCVSASDYYDQTEHPGAVTMPDFYDVHIDSVKECMRAAGWSYDDNLRYRDEVLKGDGMVLEQSPAVGEPYNPEEDGPIVLTVSTGREPTS
ncbi:protein kinase [Streptomyces sp. NPDC049879]|uniref:protein kinase domain-containing protein n=1 Tax=Streptomyces sp. NPDC049879 TaxID=3365598 RepID=UPI0037ADA6DD